MAKIPRYQENQRLSPSGPQQAYDTGAARMEGENIQNLGRQLQGFANDISQYKQVKKAADDAIWMKQWKDRADVLAQDTERKIRTNSDGSVSIDGSNMVELYDDSFTPLYDEISAVSDPRRRAMAQNAVGIARNVYRGQISDAAVATHNAWMFQETVKSNQTMGAVIASDPNQFANKLNEQKAYLMTLPLGNDNKMKLIKQAEDTAALSVISSYQEKGDYRAAEEAIKGPLSSFFSAEQRQDLIEQNEQEYRETKNEAWSDKERKRTEKIQRREDQRIETLDSIIPNINSDDPVKRDQAVAMAKLAVQSNQISQSDYDNLKKTDYEIDYSRSAEVENSYWARLERRQNLDTYIDDVVNDKSIKTEDKAPLIKAYSEAKARNKTNPLDTLKRQQAMQLIKDTFTPDKIKRALGENDYAYKNRAMREWINRIQKGEDYYTAAVRAIKNVDPTNQVLGSFQAKEILSEDKLNIQLQELKSNYERKRALGRLTVEDKKKLLESVKSIQQQRLYLKNKPNIDRALEDKDGK